MNWIIYVTFLLCKLVIILGLVLLSILTVPVIIFILGLGMLLAYVRDVESTVYMKESVFSFLTLENMKSLCFGLITQMTSHLAHISWPLSRLRLPNIRN